MSSDKIYRDVRSWHAFIGKLIKLQFKCTEMPFLSSSSLYIQNKLNLLQGLWYNHDIASINRKLIHFLAIIIKIQFIMQIRNINNALEIKIHVKTILYLKYTQYIPPINVVLELGVAGSLTMNYNTNICLCTLLIETYTSLTRWLHHYCSLFNVF